MAEKIKSVEVEMTSGDTFHVNYTDQPDWSDNDPLSVAYIKNKPKKLSDFEDSDSYITEADIASDSKYGIVKPDNDTIIIENGVLKVADTVTGMIGPQGSAGPQGPRGYQGPTGSGTGTGASDALDVSYSNVEYPTVAAALDKLLYISPTASMSGGGTYEIGSTITEVNLSWNYNKNIQTQYLNNSIGTLDSTIRSYKHSAQNITTNKTYTITANDGKNNVSASTSVSFMNKRYWGTSASSALTNAAILSLSSEFSSSRVQSRTFNCSGGKYFFFAIPASYCSGITMIVGGLSYTDFNLSTINFTNSSGYISSYNLYRSGNIQTGSSISVEVK